MSDPLREAARNLLQLRQQHPDEFRRVCRLLTDDDLETLAELAEFPVKQENRSGC